MLEDSDYVGIKYLNHLNALEIHWCCHCAGALHTDRCIPNDSLLLSLALFLPALPFVPNSRLNLAASLRVYVNRNALS